MKPSVFFGCMVLMAFTNCSTLKVAPMDPKTGKLPTKIQLKREEIVVDQSIPFYNYNQFLYVYITKYSWDATGYENYLMDNFREIGGYSVCYSETGLNWFVIQSNLSDQVPNVNDSAALAHLQKALGPFLICEITILKEVLFSYFFEIKIMEPVHREVLLDIYHRSTVWSSFPRELFNPVFNAYINWLDKCKEYKAPGG
jgi:hypothetical protein